MSETDPDGEVQGRGPGAATEGPDMTLHESRYYPRIPYGLANFRRIRMERRLYVGKTRFLHALEQVDHAVLIRPRRFGKTCWVSVLEHYMAGRWRSANGRRRPALSAHEK